MGKQKAPKAQADALTWIKQQVNDFGIAGIPLRELISFVKTALGSPNALVRASATQLLVTIKVFVGGDISGFLEDLNPQLLTTINSEFDKAASQTPPEPTRTQADLQEVAAGPGKQGKGGANPLDDLVPRVDLDKIVGQTSVITDSRNDAWKVRKEAFEALNALLDVKSNQRLKSNMGTYKRTGVIEVRLTQYRRDRNGAEKGNGGYESISEDARTGYHIQDRYRHGPAIRQVQQALDSCRRFSVCRPKGDDPVNGHRHAQRHGRGVGVHGQHVPRLGDCLRNDQPGFTSCCPRLVS